MEVARTKTPNRRDHAAAEARTRILAAAAESIVHDGLAKVRMAGIARRAGVSPGLLHYHFETKERLFADVLVHSSDVSSSLNQEVMARAGDDPAVRLSTFLDRCLPSDQQLADEWLLWQELALLCIRQPELADTGAQLYEGLYAAVAGIVDDGVEAGVFTPVFDARTVAETAVALCDGLGGRVLANDPRMTLHEARAALASTVGVLVGHAGPLPSPTT